MRYPLVIGNWKLNGSQYLVKNLITALRKEAEKIIGCTIVIAPPEIYLILAQQYLSSSKIALGAQNVDINLSGAFSGETSAVMLKDVGVKYVIIGHSERRIYHKESNDLIAKKFTVLKNQNLIPVLCIGETEIERRANKTKQVCTQQIDSILKIQGISAFKEAIIAYEPVWAIGTNKPATPLEAQKTHKFIRDYIAKYDKQIANQIIIQYGGSVNDTNVKELLMQPDIDGVLVGNASLKLDSFVKILKIAALTKYVS